ncbi:MAG: ferrous iron transport protein A [Pirellulales bacterium]|nr:ferrous iron transport protein A [Pirellulales bacterium]
MIDKAIPLSGLSVGQLAYVRRISGHPDHVHRLEEFGLRGGTRVQMFRRGSPCIIRMAGNKVCFRADDLLRILVEPETASS